MRIAKWIEAELFSWKWIPLIVIMFPIFAISRDLLFMYAGKETINQWDILFQFQNDSFFIFYFAIPLLLFYFVFIISSYWTDNILIRTQSYVHWLLHITSKVSITLISGICLWLLIGMLLSIGAPSGMGWSEYAKMGPTQGNYSYFLYQIGLSPIIVYLLQWLLLYLFLLLIFVSLATFYVFVQKLALLIALVISYYLIILVSFKLVPYWQVWLKVENIMFLFSAHFSWNTIMPPFLIVIGLIVVCIAVTYAKITISKSKFKRWVENYSAILIYTVACLVGIIAPSVGIEQDNNTLTNFLYSKFLGSAHLPSYLYYCVVYVGLLYLFQVNLVKRASGLLYYEVLRYRSYGVWFAKLLLSSITWTSVALICLALTTIGVGYIQGYDGLTELNLNRSISMGVLLYHFLINGILQMLSYFLFVFIVYWIWNNDTYNLFVLGVIIVIGSPFIPTVSYVPMALNSMSYIHLISDVWTISGVLMTWIIIQFFVIMVLFKLRIGDR